jgi:hypothetical protein
MDRNTEADGQGVSANSRDATTDAACSAIAPPDQGGGEWLADQQDAAYQAAVAAGVFDYPGERGDLATDCAAADSILGLIQGIENNAAAIQQRPARSLFADLDRVLGDGKNKDAGNEMSCNGHYSRMARGE